ncbi:hypothetical protein, partial [Thiothrix sp. UBA5583]
MASVGRLWKIMPNKYLFVTCTIIWTLSISINVVDKVYFSGIFIMPLAVAGGVLTIWLLSLWFIKAVTFSSGMTSYIPFWLIMCFG